MTRDYEMAKMTISLLFKTKGDEIGQTVRYKQIVKENDRLKNQLIKKNTTLKIFPKCVVVGE